jgi:hypothetical protein
MSNYAKVVDEKVVNVIVADEEFFRTFIDDSPGAWILTEGRIGVNFSYIDGKFVPPKKFESWQLNAAGDNWEPPVAYPDDNQPYEWDETSKQWIVKVFP